MGLGKTLSFIAYMVVERQLSCLWQQVEKSRQLKNGQHLPEGVNSAIPCPSGPKAGWIACPCTPLNVTSRLWPKSGLRLACVPSALVRSWWEQWKTHVDTGVAELALNIIVDHKGAFDNNSTSEDLLSKSDSGRSKTRSAAERYKGRGGQGDDTAKPYQDGWLVLTTKENFPTWVKHFQYDGMVKADGVGNWKKGKRVNLVFGVAMIDECHEDLTRNTGRNKILLDLPPANSPFVWGYSGTPISQSPRGLEGVLWAIERHTQSHGAKHSNYPQFSWATLNKISIDFNNQKDSKSISNDGIDKVLEKFKPFLRTFVLRRDQNTKWFGHPLIKLKPHIHQDIRLKQINPLFTPQQIEAFEASYQSEKDELLAKLQEKFDNEPEARRSNTRPTQLAFNTLCAKSWRSSLLATFPFLLNVATSGPDSQMSLTDQEALFLRGSDNKEKDNGYFRNLTSITEHSPKALWLYEFIHSLEGKKDVNGEEEKLLIITQFPQVAFILKLFISAYFPSKSDRVGLVTGRMTLKEKSETINAFTGKEKTASKRDVQILIGTTRLLGVGLQLTRAANIVLMEPDHHFVRELQGYARVHRIGQKNKLSCSYRLIDESSEIEGMVLRRQADRREFPGRRVVGGMEGGRGGEGDAGPEGT
ncbi:DNA repair protein [Lachnellula occidentalis]|uniref:DNA repair protein n=1 Tax=Lachnellula occidentalis TaxID=215460 RepID=A0A8H8S129_9HELO|nr:DNA repair protein [Lachnellula occidentalis]